MKKALLTIALIIFIQALSSSAQTTIKMQKEGGIYTVPCTVNGLTMKFIFDTGASDVSISLTEALFMLKNGQLKSEDIVGEELYQDASGGITIGTKIILRKVEFTGLTLYNVEASVVNTLNAPLLLGQTVISRLGTFQIDPSKNTLTILNGKVTDYNFASTSTTPANIESPMGTTKPFDYSKLAIYSGTVKVFGSSPIYEKADMVYSKMIGMVTDEKVTVIRKENEKYYFVSSGEITGYLFVGYIRKDQ